MPSFIVPPLYVLLLMACVVAGCNDSDSESAAPSVQPDSESNTADANSRVTLRGSGASFPAPLYKRWFSEYSRSKSDVDIEYVVNGSGAGIKDFISGKVDFAASDAAMQDDEIALVPAGVQLFPMTAGLVVFAYNLRDISEPVKLTRDAYVGIFLGTVTQWDDEIIAKSNPGLNLPDLDITVVLREDSSGTTYVLTSHLTAISDDWAYGPGTGKLVEWPSGDRFILARNNDGVAASVERIPGAIGYIDYGYAASAGLQVAWLQNRDRNFVEPIPELSGTAALEGIQMPDDLRAWIVDPEGPDAYPIVSYTWLLCYRKMKDSRRAEALRDLLCWCLKDGQLLSSEENYIPLPDSVAAVVRQAATSIR